MFKKNFIDSSKIQNKMNNAIYVNEVESAKLSACMCVCMQCANNVFVADQEVLESEKRRKAKRE
jgi:hypothetical protein